MIPRRDKSIFRYLTLRTELASLTVLLITLIIGPFVIARLREFQIGQYIREERPKDHQKKVGTPTMGGLLICIAIILPTLLWVDLSNSFTWLVMGAAVCFGAIGFADDCIKVIKRRNLGLTTLAKLGCQALVGMAVAVVLLVMREHGSYSTQLMVPFLKRFRPDMVPIHGGSPTSGVDSFTSSDAGLADPPITRSLRRTRPTHTETIARKTPIPRSQSS